MGITVDDIAHVIARISADVDSTAVSLSLHTIRRGLAHICVLRQCCKNNEIRLHVIKSILVNWLNIRVEDLFSGKLIYPIIWFKINGTISNVMAIFSNLK